MDTTLTIRASRLSYGPIRDRVLHLGLVVDEGTGALFRTFVVSGDVNQALSFCRWWIRRQNRKDQAFAAMDGHQVGDVGHPKGTPYALVGGTVVAKWGDPSPGTPFSWV